MVVGVIDDLELAILNWVYWFNEDRLQGSIGHVPPVEYEQRFHADRLGETRS